MVRSHGVICCLVCSALWRRLGKQDSHFSIPRDSVSRSRALLHPLQSRVLVPALASWFRPKLVL
jgi:hypothetical protein